MANDVPKYWKEYLDALTGETAVRHAEWQERKNRLVFEIESRPAWKKLFFDGRWALIELEWQEPRSPEPTLVGYYNWVVRERKSR